MIFSKSYDKYLRRMGLGLLVLLGFVAMEFISNAVLAEQQTCAYYVDEAFPESLDRCEAEASEIIALRDSLQEPVDRAYNQYLSNLQNILYNMEQLFGGQIEDQPGPITDWDAAFFRLYYTGDVFVDSRASLDAWLRENTGITADELDAFYDNVMVQSQALHEKVAAWRARWGWVPQFPRLMFEKRFLRETAEDWYRAISLGA